MIQYQDPTLLSAVLDHWLRSEATTMKDNHLQRCKRRSSSSALGWSLVFVYLMADDIYLFT